MPKRKSSISKSGSYRQLGEFWDTHDLSEFWDKTKPVSFDKGGKIEWARKRKFIPQRDSSLQRLATRKDGVEKDDFLALEGTLKNVDIERLIKELGKQWRTRKPRRSIE